MIDIPGNLIAAFAAGAGLGALYLGSLWLVVRRLPTARHPTLWLLGTAACRIGLLLAAWYGIAGGRWDALLACIAGFLILRITVTRIVRASIGRLTMQRG
jgi:F1F0 ATPase subunit 2